MRRFLRAALESLGYRFHEAATGQDGLAEAATRQPDVIILDLGSRTSTGSRSSAACGKEYGAHLVLSARDQEGDMIKALDLGANDYVSKPFGSGRCWPACARCSATRPLPASSGRSRSLPSARSGWT